MCELYYDNIGLKVIVGHNRSIDEYGNLQDPNVIGQRIYIFSHLDFHILYLGNKVTAIYVMNYNETVADVSEDTEVNVKFTYCVYWDDFDPNGKLLDETRVLSSVSDLFEPVGGDDPMSYATNIIIFVWIGLLCIVIVTYLRDYFTRCKCPRYSSLLGAILGVGTQLFIILGQSSLKESEIACSSINSQSEIHNQAWYMKTPAHEVFFGGLLPFCVIYILMDEIYASLYNLKVCGAISTMFGAFLIVIIQTMTVDVACERYHLSRQEPQWWWRSVFRGGSVAIFMFAYGPYFYARANARISMNLLEFLGYNACIFYAVFLILGTIGFYHSSIISNH
nr:isoform 2 of transmembrane 9 superfamily member 5 [Quercus suber]